MKTELKEISATQREIHLEIEAEAVKAVYNRVSQKYAKGANVPGFRKGFAPLDVIRMRFREEIQNEVLRELLPERVQEAIVEHGLDPLAEPQLHFEDFEKLKVNGSEPIRLHVHVEVMPEIPVPDYKGLEGVRRVRPVPEGEMERLIERRRQAGATLMPVEGRKAEAGDTLIVDLEGIFAHEPGNDPIVASDLEISLGDDGIEKSFTDALVGVDLDEEREFTVTYPADFSSELLAGKTLDYKAKIKSIGRVELPELDDEWAQSLDEGFESFAELKKRLSDDLERVANSDADAALRNDLVGKLIERHEFEIPNSLIEAQARNLLENFAKDMQQRGVDLNKVDKQFVQMAYGQMRPQAERDVRGALLLEKVAEIENVKISDEEVEQEIESMAAYYGTDVEQIRSYLKQQQGGEANIANNLRTRASVEALVKHAKVEEGEWIDPSAAPVSEPEAEKPKSKAKPKKAAAETEPAEEKPKKKAPAKKAK